jgi:DNA-binding transcriptional LysR family regulator
MLDMHRLRIFSSVVASGSVAAAAANLGYTPSAVSQHLTTLQRETGLTLLERAGRGLRPTAAGLAVAAQAEEILARLSEAEAVLSDLRTGRHGRLSMAYFASVGAAWMPEVARRLTADLPGVRLELQLRDDVASDPEDRPDIQLVVGRKGIITPGSGFDAHHLVDDPYVAVLPDQHPFAGRTEIELAELGGEQWVDNDFAHGLCRLNLLDTCAAAGFTPTFQIEAHDYATAIAFVSAGIGITVLPALSAQQLPANVRRIPVVRPAPVRSIYAVVRRSMAGTEPVQLVLDTLHALQLAPGTRAAATA